jgi:hypothetical protein
MPDELQIVGIAAVAKAPCYVVATNQALRAV